MRKVIRALGSMFSSRKGAFAIWLTALASIFVVMLIYLIFNQVFYSPYGLVDIVNASFNETAASVNLTDPLQTMDVIGLVWNKWPLVAIFGIMFWAFAASVGGKREQ